MAGNRTNRLTDVETWHVQNPERERERERERKNPVNPVERDTGPSKMDGASAEARIKATGSAAHMNHGRFSKALQ